MYGPIINTHLIQKYFSEDTQETNLGNQDVYKYVSDIISNMLTESRIHKENDDVTLENNFGSDYDHVHEDVDIFVSHGGVVNDVQMTSREDEYSDLIGLDVKQVIFNKTENIMLSAKEDVKFYDVERFAPISHLVSITLIPRLPCIQKLKLYQMVVKSAFLNRYLNVEVNQDVSNYASNKDSVIKNDDYVEVDDDIPFANIMKRIIENITKSQDNATKERDNMVNNVSDNIDDVVNDFLALLDKMSFHFKESVLKWKHLYHQRISLKRKLSKEALKFQEVIQVLEDVTMKVNENHMIVHHCYMLDKMVEHFIQKMQSEFELSMV